MPAARQSGIAVDLGSGPGFQSIALAELGYSPVTAVDSSRELLGELQARKQSYGIETWETDITRLDWATLPENASVLVCMGDTLTHLPSKDSVQKLFTDVFEKLAAGGVFVLTYRDLTGELAGTDRFLPVQADDTRIMTCFLEYKSSDAVTVHDLVYVRGEDEEHTRDAVDQAGEHVLQGVRSVQVLRQCQSEDAEQQDPLGGAKIASVDAGHV